MSKHQITDIAGLIKRVQDVGQTLTVAQPKELAVRNIVLRVLGVIRDEADEDRKEEGSHPSEAGENILGIPASNQLSPPGRARSSSSSKSNPPQHGDAHTRDLSPQGDTVHDANGVGSAQQRLLALPQPTVTTGISQPLLKSMFNLLSHPTSNTSTPAQTPGTQSPAGSFSHPMDTLVGADAAKDLRAEIVEAVEEIIEELKTADDQIAGYALDHIHSNEIILTHTASVTVQKFLIKAAAKRKFTVIHAESFPNDHENVHATVTGSLKANASGAAGVTVVLIPDSAVFAVMSRVNKVILGTHSVLANGSLVAATGSKSIAKAASVHKAPVVVLSAVYKLSPLYPFSSDPLIEFGSPSKMFSNEDADLIDKVDVENPLYDHVPSELIDLYITNL